MINNKEIDLIDVSLTYFDIPIDKDKLFRVGCDDMNCDNRNKIIGKKEAIELFKKTYPLQNCEVAYCSSNAVIAKQIKDYNGTELFPMVNENWVGWFFFVDDMPFANWAHSCKYYFIVDENNIFQKAHTIGISDCVLVEKIL